MSSGVSNRENRGGVFMVTLDFELAWGVRDKKSIEKYRENLLGARRAIPRLLDLFAEYEVHATWATVGFLFFETRDDLLAALPERRPEYTDSRFSPYDHVKSIGADERADQFHFAPSLIRLIANRANQEIASHTFSHYYGLEEGQGEESFREDLRASIAVAKKMGITLESLVFPRNQIHRKYLPICKELGIRAYRGNPPGRLFRERSEREMSLLLRTLRFADAYIAINRQNNRPLSSTAPPVDIPASRYLRPYSNGLRFLEPLRLRRIKREMTHAASQNLVYHVWWHPHNFGANIEENLTFLKKVLSHFQMLKKTRGTESLTMREMAQRLLEER